MYCYRFHGPYDYSKPFTRSFVSDSQAFVFADDMTDGPERATVWKEIGGNWHAWDCENETWVYDPVASSEL